VIVKASLAQSAPTLTESLELLRLKGLYVPDIWKGKSKDPVASCVVSHKHIKENEHEFSLK